MSECIYSQSTGIFWLGSGERLEVGYSGFGAGKNNKDFQHIRDVGPIPRGVYSIGRVYDSAAVGPHAITLTPVGHDALGRTAFLIHGDSVKNPGSASKGCVILSRKSREKIIAAGSKTLRVIEEIL